MKPLIPFALLGTLGLTGVFVGAQRHVADAPSVVTPVTDSDGSVTVVSALEHQALPANTDGETFVRVALTGKAAPGKSDRLPVSLTLVIDRSGSMGRDKMEDAKRAALEALRSLQPGDRAAVVSFDSGAELLAARVEIGNGNLDDVTRAVNGLFARGGTDMVSGLRVGGQAALSLYDPSRVNRLLLLSDGNPDTSTGLADQTKDLAARGIQTTTLGLGNDYNEDLMAHLADAGLGHYYFVEKSAALAGIFAEELKALSQVVAKETMVEITGLHGAKVVEVIGFEVSRQGDRVLIPVGDVYASRTRDLLVRVAHGRRTGTGDVVTVHTTYRDVLKEGQRAATQQLAARFVHDQAIVTASLVPDVAVKAEKWRTANAMIVANEAYNRGDQGGGDKIIHEQRLRLQSQSAFLGSADLADEEKSLGSYQQLNAAPEASRGAMNKMAKQKARALNRAE